MTPAQLVGALRRGLQAGGVVTDRMCSRRCPTTKPSAHRRRCRPPQSRARSEADVQRVEVRSSAPSSARPSCRAARVPACPGGGANAIAGCVVLDLSQLNQILEIDTDNLVCGRAGRGHQRRSQGRRRRARALVPARPASAPWSTIGGNVASRRGRVVLPQVRRHPRLRPRLARGGRRSGRIRNSGPARAADHQGRHGTGSGRPVRRVRRHPRRGHRGNAAVRPARPASPGPWSPRSAPWSTPATRWRGVTGQA